MAAKKKYSCEKFNELKSNLKISWKLIKEITNKNKFKTELPDKYKDNKKIIPEPTEIAKTFKEFFGNVGPNLAKKKSLQVITKLLHHTLQKPYMKIPYMKKLLKVYPNT